MKHILKHPLFLLVAISWLFSALACQAAAPTQTPAPSQASATPHPTAASTPAPLGDPGNPLVMGIAGSTSQEALSAADEIARMVSEQTGYAVRARLFATYDALIEEMRNGRIHLAWLPPATYLYANEHGFADARLISNHFGVYEYGVQFLANANSGLQIYFDPLQGQNAADALTALSQFSGKIPCLIDPDSISGFLIPTAILAENHVDWAEPLYLRSHTGIVRALYITGICDFGATFAISGDPRTSSLVQGDLTDAIQRVPIIWRSDPVIPNLGLAFLPDVPSNIEASIEFALQDLSKSEDGRQLLTTANEYEIQDLKSIDDSFYQRFRELITLTGRNTRDLIGK